MKRTTGVLVTLCILAAMLTTGCNLTESLQQILNRSYNKWYKYTGSANLGDIPLGSDAEEDGNGVGLHSLKDAEYYFYFDPDEGLTLAIQAKVSQNVDLLGGLASTTVETYAGGTKQYTQEQFGVGYWTLLITNVSLTACDEPVISSDPGSCIKLYGEGAGEFKIQWKKVLAQKLLTALLGNYLED